MLSMTPATKPRRSRACADCRHTDGLGSFGWCKARKGVIAHVTDASSCEFYEAREEDPQEERP